MGKNNHCDEIKPMELADFKSRVEMHLNKLYEFYINSLNSWIVSEHLNSPRTQEEKDLTWNDPFIDGIKHVLIKNCIIELAKAFNHIGSNDCFTTSKLFSLIRENQQHLESVDFLEDLEEEKIKSKTPIDDVLYLRKKLYAHLDSDFNMNDVSLNGDKIHALITLLGSILKTTGGTILDGHYFLEDEIPKLEIHLLSDIVTGRKIRRDRSNPLKNKKP